MKKNKDMVYKSNSLIEASYRLSVMEQRILLSCMAQIEKGEEVTDQVLYSVSAKDIANISGSSSKSLYKELETAALRLKRREVRLPYLPNGRGPRGGIMLTGWVQTVCYIESEGKVELRFSKDMLPYISKLTKEFTRYSLKHVAAMTSAYAVRLYELIVQWREIGSRKMELLWLREALQLEGRYKTNKDLKKWVLEPAITQINQHSNFHVTHEYIKTGRKITHLFLNFHPKAEGQDQKKYISKNEILKRALPGESWEQAESRIKRKQEERCAKTIDMFDEL